jgi:glycosyltransferase involved in cell wall biosynthesis
MKKITIVSPTYNEEKNVSILYQELKKIFQEYPVYDFDILIIDNASEDGTQVVLRNIAENDKSVKLIFNTRNFGHIRSPYWAMLNTNADAAIFLASDLQDPPELIPKFIAEWEKGWKVVYGTKPDSDTNSFMHSLRKLYYKAMNRICDYPIVENATGFGLYDKVIIDHIVKINDPLPFFRGLVSDLGYPIKTVEFVQKKRKYGISKNKLFDLYQYGIFSIVSQSILPIRIISLIGFLSAIASIFVLVFYLILKFSYWNDYPTGIIPAICITIFLFSILLTILGVLGEYMLLMLTYMRNRPIVVESERINF